MLTQVTIRSFKCFGEVKIELGNTVVFIGPNNSGKTVALQALALWEVGVKRWIEKRGLDEKAIPKQRPGVTINRRDLVAVPVPNARLLWHNLRVRQPQNILMDIIVDGVTNGRAWTCGLEFDYANVESFYCRPLLISEDQRMPVPEEASSVHVAFLPPMSGLAANERRLDMGAVNVLIGEGRTAEVLRNLCYQIVTMGDNSRWSRVCEQIDALFGVSLDEPTYVAERGEIEMTYRDHSVQLDLSSSGRGLQQTLLLLAYMAVNPGSVLLLDEPDAHLEILRQRQIYQILSEAAQDQDSQIIVASHSEVILNEAAGRDIVVAFLGRPHRIDDRGSQLLKSLTEIGFEQYYQAEQTGWVLYLEGSTDLAILQRFAETLKHPARNYLERPFVYYVLNQPSKAQEHFHGLREAKPDLQGFALFDRLERLLPDDKVLTMYMWKRREIENYLCDPDVLRAWAKKEAQIQAPGPLFSGLWNGMVSTMDECVKELEKAMETLQLGSPWSPDTKVTDQFLDRLFPTFLTKLKLPPDLMRKTDYHVLADLVPKEKIDLEVIHVLDLIVAVAERANPAE